MIYVISYLFEFKSITYDCSEVQDKKDTSLDNLGSIKIKLTLLDPDPS
jgi:hypothetical protein